MEHHDIRQFGETRMLSPAGPDLAPEDKLAVAIIERAYRDVVKGQGEVVADALEYFRGADFADHCALLGVQPERLQLPKVIK